MSSIIEGYNYDIFISYRQKDNKGDKWVSEFVEVLKTELESTFKEEISVYFDINPHDGLLETHDVDASLKEKLKCLVFIPIISRTYCDPKSFAWEQEFKAFVEQASQDKFGLKVKLPNGNIANRVLPVQIHDLSAEDKLTVEKVLQGYLRALEFIYREPGVDRPLATKDSEEKNLNKTNYRNQINKVALAVREIITSMQQKISQKNRTDNESHNHVFVPPKNRKTKVIAGSAIALALVIFSLLLVPEMFDSRNDLEKSIAVLPFRNDSSDEENLYFINGTMEAILLNLSKVEDLRVISRTSVEQYRHTTKSVRQIAKELDVNFILEGSGQKYGDDIKLNVQLLDAVNDRNIWSRPYEKKMHDIYLIQGEIAKDIAAELRAALSPEEISKIDRKPTENIEAYNLYLKGRHFLNRRTEDDLKKSIIYFEQAIDLDTTFAQAYTSLAETYIVLGEWTYSQPDEVFPKAEKAVARAIKLDDGLAEAHNAMAAIKRDYKWDWKGAEAEYLKAIKLNPRYPTTYQWYAEFLSIMGRNSEAIENLKQAQELDPLSPIIYTIGGRIIYPNARQYDIAIQQCRKALEIDSNYVLAHHSLAYIYFYKEMFTEAIAEANIVLELSGWTSAKILLAKVYVSSGRRKEAEIILDEIVENRDKPYTSSTAISTIYLALGRKEEALDWIEKAYLNREYNLIHIGASPDYDKFRDEPRFIAILKKMGFEE